MMAHTTYEVELVLVKPLISEDDIFNILPDGFYMEKGNKDRRIAISIEHKTDDNLKDMVSNLLLPLCFMREIIEHSQGVLRIAVYNPFFTCELQIDNIKLLAELNVIPLISIYPTSDE